MREHPPLVWGFSQRCRARAFCKSGDQDRLALHPAAGLQRGPKDQAGPVFKRRPLRSQPTSNRNTPSLRHNTPVSRWWLSCDLVKRAVVPKGLPMANPSSNKWLWACSVPRFQARHSNLSLPKSPWPSNHQVGLHRMESRGTGERCGALPLDRWCNVTAPWKEGVPFGGVLDGEKPTLMATSRREPPLAAVACSSPLGACGSNPPGPYCAFQLQAAGSSRQLEAPMERPAWAFQSRLMGVDADAEMATERSRHPVDKGSSL